MAQIEAYKVFGIDLLFENLVPMETEIEKLKDHYSFCSTLNYSSDRSKCFYKLLDFLKGAKRDFMWNISPSVSKQERPKFGTMYLSFTAMSVLLSSISSLNMKCVDDRFTKETWILDFSNEIDNINNMLFDYERDITVWRLDQITPVQICEITQYFWKNYEGVCETRWRRDIALENEDEADNNSNGNSNDNQTTFGYSSFNDFVFSVVDKIGRDADPFEKFYKGKVIDTIQKKILFEKVEYVKNSDIRGNKLNILLREGMKKRGEHEKRVRAIMESFNKNTIKLVRQLITAYYKNRLYNQQPIVR